MIRMVKGPKLGLIQGEKTGVLISPPKYNQPQELGKEQ